MCHRPETRRFPPSRLRWLRPAQRLSNILQTPPVPSGKSRNDEPLPSSFGESLTGDTVLRKLAGTDCIRSNGVESTIGGSRQAAVALPAEQFCRLDRIMRKTQHEDDQGCHCQPDAGGIERDVFVDRPGM